MKKNHQPLRLTLLKMCTRPFLVLFVPVIALCASAAYRHRSATINAQADRVADIAAAAAENTIVLLDALARAKADTLSDILAEVEHNADSLLPFLADRTAAAAGASRIWFIAHEGVLGDGFLTLEWVPGEESNSIETRALTLDAVRDNPITGIPLFLAKPFFAISASDSPRVGTIAYPVAAPQNANEIAGVVGMDFEYGSLFDRFTPGTAPAGNRILLVSDAGDVLFSRDNDWTGRNLPEAYSAPGDREHFTDILKLDRPHTATLVSPVSGGLSRILVRPLAPGTSTEAGAAKGEAFVLVDVPLAAAKSSATRDAALVVAAGLLALAGLALYWRQASRKAAEPVAVLADAAHRMTTATTTDGPADALSILLPEPGSEETDRLARDLVLLGEGAAGADELRHSLARAEEEGRKIADSSKSKERFFASMSHEIRTPMNAILGMSELLLSEPMQPQQTDRVKDIKIAAESLLGIINDILDLSKFESGNLSLVSVDYDLSLLMENINSMTFFLAKEKKLDFRYEAEEGLPRYLLGDEMRLRQVLLNILGNSVKFTKKGGITLRAAVRGDTIEFAVSDTGIGIRPEDMDALFEPFKQLDEKKNRAVKGTGLGLSISRNLVQLMGGDITVESVYGEGTTFRIVIPKIEGDGARIAENEEDGGAVFSSTAKVLVVDDIEVNRSVASGLMKLNGVACDTAGSGLEAIRMAEAQEYAIVFMDHMMPDMDGVEAARRIRAIGPEYADTPIIALTANAVVGMKEIYLAAGMNDFLAKPIEKAKLRSILVKWMPRAGGTTRIEYTEMEMHESTVFPTGGGSCTVLELARRIDGLDVSVGMSRVSGQQDMYEEILHLAGETIPSLIETILTAYGEGDMERLHIEVHGAKGSMATIGAVRLSEEAAALERASADRDMEYVETRLPGFLESLQKLGEDIQNLFVLFASPATTLYGDLTQLQVRLHKLTMALTQGTEPDILKILKSVINRDFGAEINGKLAVLKELVDKKDYAGSVRHIETFIGQLGD